MLDDLTMKRMTVVNRIDPRNPKNHSLRQLATHKMMMLMIRCSKMYYTPTKGNIFELHFN